MRMVICLSVLALHQIVDLSSVYPSSCPVVAGAPCDPDKDKQKRLDG